MSDRPEDASKNPAGEKMLLYPSPTPEELPATIKAAPYIAFALALVWCLAAGAVLADWLGVEKDLAFEMRIVLISIAMMPGLVLAASGYMIWEVRRSQLLSRDMAEIAHQLLLPIENETAGFDRVANAVSAHMHRMGGDLQRACEHAARLTVEIEKSLDGLTEATTIMKTDGALIVGNLRDEGEKLRKICVEARDHIDALTQSFPVQAQILAGVVRDAEREMGLAEQLLERRTDSLGRTGADIAGKMEEMERSGAQSEQRAEAMQELVTGIHKRIGEMVGRVEAVLNMSEQAREGSSLIVSEIEQRLEKAMQAGVSTLEKLECSDAKISERADNIMEQAEKHLSQTEEKMSLLGGSVYETAAEATRIAETGLNSARARIEKATRLLNQTVSVEDKGEDISVDRKNAVMESEKEGRADVLPESARVGKNGTSWKDLLAEIDEPAKVPENVEKLIQHLQDSGISLHHVVTAPDLRRLASLEGVEQRHLALRKLAPGHLRDIEEMMGQSPELRELAKSFIGLEESKALKRLSGKSQSGADARLCAYLLLDAALGMDVS